MFYDKSIPDPYYSSIPFLGPYLAAAADTIGLDLKHLIFRSLRAFTPLWLQSIVMPLLMGPLRRPLPRLVGGLAVWLSGHVSHYECFIIICALSAPSQRHDAIMHDVRVTI